MEFIVHRRAKHEDELYHHQSQGAKWGVHNGPPYPLSQEKRKEAGLKPAKTPSNKNIKERAKDVVGKVQKKIAKSDITKSVIKRYGRDKRNSAIKLASEAVGWVNASTIAGKLLPLLKLPVNRASLAVGGPIAVITVTRIGSKMADTFFKKGVDAQTQKFVRSEIKKRLAEYERQKELDRQSSSDFDGFNRR